MTLREAIEFFRGWYMCDEETARAISHLIAAAESTLEPRKPPEIDREAIADAIQKEVFRRAMHGKHGMQYGELAAIAAEAVIKAYLEDKS